MKKILILALLLMSAKLLAIELTKDTLWTLQTGKYWFNNAKFSLDDKKIYANTREGVLVLDAQKGDSLDFIAGINIGRESLDGSYFMSIHPKDIRTKDNNVEKYDSQTRQKIWTCPKREKDDLLFVAFSQNAKYVLLIYSNTNLDIYNTETQELVKSLHYNTFAWLDNGFAIDNNGEKILVTAPIIKDMKFGEVSYLINAVSGEIIKEMYFAEGIQLNQSSMFSAQNNFALAKWQIYSSVLNLRNMDSFVYAPTGGISHLLGIISPDEKYLVSGGAKIGSVELYDIKNKKIIYTADKITNTNGNVGIWRYIEKE